MKKILILMALAIFPAMGYAQKEKKVSDGNGGWTLSAGIGANAYIGENDLRVAGKGEMIAFPAVDLGLTRWFSPVFGVGMDLNAFRFKGLYQATGAAKNPAFATGKPYTDADPTWDYMNLSLQSGMALNASLLAHLCLGGILDIYAGPGALLGFDKKIRAGYSLNAGGACNIPLVEKLGLRINVHGAVVQDTFDGESFKDEPDQAHIDKNVKMDGMLGATLGISYRFGK